MGLSENSTSELKLVVGLGNPGAKYEWTRHNIGFECLNRLHQSLGKPALQTKFEAQFVKTKIAGVDCCLIWPLTYMNCSGRSVSQFMRFYRVEPENVLVICDDLSLPLGKLRVRKSGSSGGQKGLDDILRCSGTQDIPRLRIGIDPTPDRWETADYVLGKFTRAESDSVEQALLRSVQAIECWLSHGVETAMNLFNAPATSKKKTDSETKPQGEK